MLNIKTLNLVLLHFNAVKELHMYLEIFQYHSLAA